MVCSITPTKGLVELIVRGAGPSARQRGPPKSRAEARFKTGHWHLRCERGLGRDKDVEVLFGIDGVGGWAGSAGVWTALDRQEVLKV